MAVAKLQKLEADVAGFLDSFATLVRSAHITEDSEEGKHSQQVELTVWPDARIWQVLIPLA